MTSDPGRDPGGLDALLQPDALDERAVRRSLDRWKQGDIVTGLRLFWATGLGPDPLTGLDAGTGTGGGWRVLAWDEEDSPDGSWGVIGTQTCDVAATGPGRSQLHVQVHPVKRLDGAFDAGRIAEIRRGQSTNLIYLTAPPIGGEWAADLRMSLPVSKTLLCHQEPKHAFACERDSLDFAERIAAKARRPALHDQLSGPMVSSLRDMIRQAQSNEENWPDLFEQFRLLVTDGGRLTPRTVQLLAISHANRPLPSDRRALREWRTRESKRLTRAADITLSPITFIALTDLDAQRYRQSVPLHVPELGRVYT